MRKLHGLIMHIFKEYFTSIIKSYIRNFIGKGRWISKKTKLIKDK